ncbi:hypothetical protein FALBO_16708 [Fusarium albosuccineum]|uniref:Heterokaryon incompatibility domain-containing protein n=1 Tax=Fusarium albosuccineum TaxID=1237068 RepID=A0A8H4KFF3_9HYPO|nr:hypothetical protein FALBO_16708 [Fusarium albosuccineum]
MPTRLLDLGSHDSKSWRVFKTRKKVEYIALSHRWSDATPKLLREGSEGFHNYQHDNVLPQDYQDIISICRAMSIRYLWIDSLCIFQDKEDDFHHEAAIMMDIYQNAFLTLSICWDFSGASIFRKRRPRTIPRKPPRLHQIEASPVSGNFAFVGYAEFDDNVANSLINRRGWVLQERCLSRRMLYLGNDHLYWDCDGDTNTGITSEAGPENSSASGQRTSIFTDEMLLVNSSWPDLVSKYTRCALTRKEDKFIAISGLAQVFAKRTGGAYFAGIWTEYWAPDLLWTPATANIHSYMENVTTEASSGLRAPSWSWAGFQGPVTLFGGRFSRPAAKLNSFKFHDIRPLAKLVGTIPAEIKSFGSFEKATLKLQCLLIPLKFDKVRNKDVLQQISTDRFPTTFYGLQDVQLSSMGLDCLQLGDDDSLFIIPILLQKWLDDADFHEANIDGLVVQEQFDGQNREFTRIGTFKTGPKTENPGIDTIINIYRFGLSPVISNTVVLRGVGTRSGPPGWEMMAEEDSFDSKLGEYAATQVDIPVRDRRDDKMVECSLLPHFETAEWATICLV